MYCLRCEVTRARIRAAYGLIVGRTLADIAADLSKRYGASYEVRGNEIWRRNNPVDVFVLKDG